MIAVGGIIGSIIFGILSDIFGRRAIIRITLLISCLSTIFIFSFCISFDYWYNFLIKDFNKNFKIIKEDPSFSNIISHLYAQNKIRI